MMIAATTLLAASWVKPPVAAAIDLSGRIDIRPPIDFSTLCLLGVTCVPTKRALLVLMENEGFKLGLPEEVTVEVPTCGNFSFVFSTQDDRPFLEIVADYAAQVTRIFTEAAQCAIGIGWSSETMDLSEYVNAVNDFELAVSDTVLEDLGRATIENSGADEVYDRVEILEDGDFKRSRIRAVLAELAPQYVVDIHVLAHGNTVRIGPKHADVDERMSATAIAELGNIRGLHLRAVYQQNCFGRFMRDEWRTAGADVVNGSKHINYMSFAYSAFLRRWLDGETFKQAVRNSVTEWTPFYTEVFHHVDIYTHPSATEAERRNPFLFSIFGNFSANDELKASRMLFSGNANLRVTD